MVQCHFYGLSVFLAHEKLGIDTEIINFELIFTDLWPFEGFGGHLGRHLEKKHFRINMSLGTQIGLGPGDIVLYGAQLSPERAHPKFSPLMSIVAKRSPISYTAEHLFFSFSEYRADNFIVGLTDVSPATTAPTLWNYTVCAQYPGVVGDGTVYLPCASRMPPHRYLIVQIELVNENLNFCEIEVLVRRHRKLV